MLCSDFGVVPRAAGAQDRRVRQQGGVTERTIRTGLVLEVGATVY